MTSTTSTTSRIHAIIGELFYFTAKIKMIAHVQVSNQISTPPAIEGKGHQKRYRQSYSHIHCFCSTRAYELARRLCAHLGEDWREFVSKEIVEDIVEKEVDKWRGQHPDERGMPPHIEAGSGMVARVNLEFRLMLDDLIRDGRADLAEPFRQSFDELSGQVQSATEIYLDVGKMKSGYSGQFFEDATTKHKPTAAAIRRKCERGGGKQGSIIGWKDDFGQWLYDFDSVCAAYPNEAEEFRVCRASLEEE